MIKLFFLTNEPPNHLTPLRWTSQREFEGWDRWGSICGGSDKVGGRVQSHSIRFKNTSPSNCIQQEIRDRVWKVRVGEETNVESETSTHWRF